MTTDRTAPNARKRKFRCQTWPIDDVRLANRSVRRHKPRQIAMLKASLERFGQFPILVSSKGEIIDGHAVTIAVRELGWSTIRVIVVDGFSPDEVKALRIALNKQAEAGGWDYEVLAEDLADLIDLDFDVEELGFEIAEVDKIFDVASIVADGEVEDEPVSSESLIRVGDCFQIGPHKLLCGDSTKVEFVEQLMGSDLARAALTDPPYNVAINGHVSGLGAASHRDFVMGSGEMSDVEFGQFLHSSISAMLFGIEKGGLLFIAMDWRGIERLLRVGRELKLELINVCVWVKNNAGMGSFYRSQHEFFAVFRKPGASHRNNIQLGRFGRHRSNVWHYDSANSFGRTRDEDLAMHPTVKPTPLIEDIMKDCTKQGEIVLDPFGGSGTVLIAAQKIKRVARVMELDPRYVETALRRYQKRFKEVPIHVETGLSLDELIAQRREEPAAPIVRRRTRMKKGAAQ